MDFVHVPIDYSRAWPLVIYIDDNDDNEKSIGIRNAKQLLPFFPIFLFFFCCFTMKVAGTIDEDVIFNEFWGTQEVRRKNFIWTELLPDGFFLLQVNEF